LNEPFARGAAGARVYPAVRILVLASTFPRWLNDDQPAFVLELCRRLARDLEITVVVPHAAGAARRETIDGVAVRRFRYGPERFETLVYGGGMRSRLAGRPLRALLLPLFAIAQVATVTRILQRERIDVVHAHWIVPQGLTAVIARVLARSRVRVVCTSHGGDLFALRGRIWTALKRGVLSRVDAVSVVSEAMRAEVARLVPGRDDVVVAPMGTDLHGRFVPDWATERHEDVLLFVGRLVPKKGVDFLLRTLGRLDREFGRRPRLRIVGSGPEEEALRRIVLEEGMGDRVEFCGFRSHDELPSLYQRCTAAVFPFREDPGGDQEGFGLVVVEALGCGCPVIVSALPSVRDIIGEGRDLLAVPPDDLGAWARAIDGLLRDPRAAARMGQAGRKRVVERFDWDACADRYLRLLPQPPGGRGHD